MSSTQLLFLRVHSPLLLVLSIHLVLKPPETKQNILSFVGQVLLALLSVGGTITSQHRHPQPGGRGVEVAGSAHVYFQSCGDCTAGVALC